MRGFETIGERRSDGRDWVEMFARRRMTEDRRRKGKGGFEMFERL